MNCSLVSKASLARDAAELCIDKIRRKGQMKGETQVRLFQFRGQVVYRGKIKDSMQKFYICGDTQMPTSTQRQANQTTQDGSLYQFHQ